MPTLADALTVVGSRLRCPSCPAPLVVAGSDLTCPSCKESWSRPPGGHVDLRIRAWDAAMSRWQWRQDETCRY